MGRRLDAWRARRPSIDLALSVIDKGGRDGVGRLSTVLAYYSFFSLLSLLLVATTIIGTMSTGSWGERIRSSALANLPVIGQQIGDAVEPLSGLSWNTAIGSVVALWAGTHAFEAYEHAMHVVHLGRSERHPGYLHRRVRAVVLMGIFGLGIVGTTVLGAIVSSVGVPGLDLPLGITVTVAANAALLLVMYEVSVPGHQGFRRLLPGAVTGGVGLSVLHLVGGVYLARVVATARDTYGVFGTVIGLLTWVNLIGKVVIWSAELNTVLADRADTANASISSPVIEDEQVMDGA